MISTELQMGKAGEHITCADLILQGFNAFLADQGLPYDVLVDFNGRIYKIQVKATGGLVEAQLHRPLVYRFQIKKGRNQSEKRTPISPDIADFFAFVALDVRRVAYIPTGELLGKSGKLLQTLNLRSRGVQYPKPKCGRYFEDFTSFQLLIVPTERNRLTIYPEPV